MQRRKKKAHAFPHRLSYKAPPALMLRHRRRQATLLLNAGVVPSRVNVKHQTPNVKCKSPFPINLRLIPLTFYI